MCFDDGASPPEEIIDEWNGLVRSTFDSKKKKSGSAADSQPCIAIHCVAGLGRYVSRITFLFALKSWPWCRVLFFAEHRLWWQSLLWSTALSLCKLLHLLENEEEGRSMLCNLLILSRTILSGVVGALLCDFGRYIADTRHEICRIDNKQKSSAVFYRHTQRMDTEVSFFC